MPAGTAALGPSRAGPALESLRRAVATRTTALFAGSLLVILAGSWTPAWSADETATVMVVRRSWPEVLRTVRFDAALEPYYVVLKVWAGASTSPVWLRLPSAVAMAAAVATLAALVGRVAGTRAATIAALLLLVMPATSRFGQEARPYALAVLLVVVIVSRWARDEFLTSRRRQVEVAVLVVIAGAAHPYALVVAPILVVAAVAAPRIDRRREVALTAVTTGAGLAVLAPFLVVAARHSSGEPNPPGVTPVNVLTTAGRLPVEILSPPLAVVSAGAVLALAAAGLLLRRRAEARWFTVLVTVWLVLPAALLTALQATTGRPGLVTRYWLFSLPALAVAAAFAVERLRSRTFVAALGVALAGVSLPTQLVARTPNGHLGQGWRSFEAVLDLPLLSRTPLVTASWNYHGLVANDASVAARMPLVHDPAPAGRIVPQHDRPGTETFAALVRADRVVIVLVTRRTTASLAPTVAAFGEFRAELRSFPVADVLCRWFGQPLGVFAASPAAVSAIHAAELAREIHDVATGSVRCVAGPRRT